MADHLFIQFYSRSREGIYSLNNGFSDTWDLCRARGELLWVEHRVPHARRDDPDAYAEQELPVRQGTVLVSALTTGHLYQAYVWARRHPGLRVVVGGPVASEKSTGTGRWDPLYVKVDDPGALPPNLVITGRSVEDWLGVPDFSGTWRVELPDGIPPEAPVYVSYTLDNGCYWGRCVYCNIGLHAKERFRRRRRLAYEFAGMDHPGPKIIRLNTGSITPGTIRRVIPGLPREGFEYRTFMRSARAENDALEGVIEQTGGRLPDLVLGLGLEFPSDRMLRRMGKGFGTSEMLRTLRICRDAGIRVNANLILGWKDLTGADLEDLERFFDRLPEGAFTTAQVRWLLAHPHTPIHEAYLGDPIRLGPFYEGFRVRIGPEQLARNRRAAEILLRYSRKKGFELQGWKGLQEHLEAA